MSCGVQSGVVVVGVVGVDGREAQGAHHVLPGPPPQVCGRRVK